MIGANRDVSKLRNLTEQLSEQHELLRVTLDSITNTSIFIDQVRHLQIRVILDDFGADLDT